MRLRIFNVDLFFHFGFFAIPAVIFCFESGTYFLPILLAYIVHESGHIFAAVLCKMRISCIRFGALGIHMMGDTQNISVLRRAVVSVCGPLANFLMFICLLPLGAKWYAAELLLFVFHILPAVPLDGGTALYSALCSVMHERTAAYWCAALAVIIAFLLGVLGFSVLLKYNGNFSLLLTACYILIYVLTKQRGDLC